MQLEDALSLRDPIGLVQISKKLKKSGSESYNNETHLPTKHSCQEGTEKKSSKHDLQNTASKTFTYQSN